MIILQKLSSRIAVAIVFWCFFPVSSWAADDATRVRAIVEKAIHPLTLKYDVPGVTVAVTINNKSYFINYGVASRERTGAVTENTLFEIGSVSKMFTATLASYAQVQGMLSLHDRPSQYLPQLKNSAIDKATLLELGTYSAGGLPLQVPGEISNTQQAMAYFQTWKPEAEPGVVRSFEQPEMVARSQEFFDVSGRGMCIGIAASASNESPSMAFDR